MLEVLMLCVSCIAGSYAGAWWTTRNPHGLWLGFGQARHQAAAAEERARLAEQREQAALATVRRAQAAMLRAEQRLRVQHRWETEGQRPTAPVSSREDALITALRAACTARMELEQLGGPDHG